MIFCAGLAAAQIFHAAWNPDRSGPLNWSFLSGFYFVPVKLNFMVRSLCYMENRMRKTACQIIILCYNRTYLLFSAKFDRKLSLQRAKFRYDSKRMLFDRNCDLR